MKGLMKLENRTAVVTGAASGIGRATALSLAQRSCHLALADINQAGLNETQAMAAKYGVRVSCHKLDVADAKAVAAFPDVVRAEHPGVDLLFNIAGVALGGTFDQVSQEDFEWLMNINFYGVVRMTRAFLPLLKASEDARLVNMSSVFGLVAPPGQTAYSASKFAVRGFSEALRHELVGTRLGVTVVHPGGVNTNIAKNARMPAGTPKEDIARGVAAIQRMLKMPPEEAGEIIVKGVQRRQDRVLVGSDARQLAWIVRIAPVSYWNLVKRM